MKCDKQTKCSGFLENIDLIEAVLAIIEADLDRYGELTLYMKGSIEPNTKLVAIGPPNVKCVFVR